MKMTKKIKKLQKKDTTSGYVYVEKNIKKIYGI